MIGDGDIVLLCIMKCADMIKQLQTAVAEGAITKITIENFQKRDDILFTSERSSIEIDSEVFI